MNDFSADWLALREPADGQARDQGLLDALTDWRRPATQLSVLDLGAGTGASLRALAARLSGRQDWLLLDYDRALFARMERQTEAWAAASGFTVAANRDRLRVTGPELDVTVRSRVVDLSAAVGSIDIPNHGLVTASALLDLVSASWIEVLAARCRDAQAAFYAPLIYDGRMDLAPPLALDVTVRDLVNRHQTRDKGFGAALGPAACETACDLFAACGYEVSWASSDWCLDRTDSALVAELCKGWASAAGVVEPEGQAAVATWLAQRLDLARAPSSAIRVGHQDLLALPPRSQSNSTS